MPHQLVKVVAQVGERLTVAAGVGTEVSDLPSKDNLTAVSRWLVSFQRCVVRNLFICSSVKRMVIRQGMVIFGSTAFTCCFDFVVVFFLIVKCVIEYFNLRTNLLLVAVIAGFQAPLLIEIVTLP